MYVRGKGGSRALPGSRETGGEGVGRESVGDCKEDALQGCDEQRSSGRRMETDAAKRMERPSPQRSSLRPRKATPVVGVARLCCMLVLGWTAECRYIVSAAASCASPSQRQGVAGSR